MLRLLLVLLLADPMLGCTSSDESPPTAATSLAADTSTTPTPLA
jgi:hypothetical protein